MPTRNMTKLSRTLQTLLIFPLALSLTPLALAAAGVLPSVTSVMPRTLELSRKGAQKRFNQETKGAKAKAPAKTSKQEATKDQQLVDSGFSKMNQGDYSGAQGDFTEALKVNPENVDAFANRGSCRYLLGDHINAIADQGQALRLSPNWFFPWYLKGKAKIALNDFQSAADDLSQSIKFDESWLHSYLYRGMSRYYSKDYPRAIEDFSHVIAKDPRYWDAYWFRCWTNIKSNNLPAAKQDCIEMVRIAPGEPDSHRIYGYVLKEMGDSKGAIAEFKKAAELYAISGNFDWQQVMLAEVDDLQGQPGARASAR